MIRRQAIRSTVYRRRSMAEEYIGGGVYSQGMTTVEPTPQPNVTREAPRASRPWRLTPLTGASLAVTAAAAACLVVKPTAWRLAAGMIALDHGLLFAGGTLPRASWLGPNVSRLPASSSANEIVLTLDDGPDPAATPAVLDILDAYDARATFFVVGRRVAEHPELTRQMWQRGHGVENHTYHHRHTFAFKAVAGLQREIGQAQEAIAQATGRYPEYFRAPAGMRNLFLEPALASQGLSLVSWTRRAYDAVERDATKVHDRLLGSASAGDILLLHDGYGPRDAIGQPVILDVLPKVLETLARRGLKVISLPSGL